jgi:acetolactate decarboxylase
MKTRSIPPQQKPYRTLEEVLKTQPLFDFKNIKGTMVGYRLPSFIKGINKEGYHFHFITKDKKSGGHVLELETSDIKAAYARQGTIRIFMPQNKEFEEINFSR